MLYTIRKYKMSKKTEYAPNWFEIPYTDFYMDGTIAAVGTEDFNRERKNTIYACWIWTWDGVKRQNGGKRFFENWGLFYFPNREHAKAYADAMYPDAAKIDIRKF